MAEQKPNADDLTRIIVLVYGILESNAPFWVFVAVKPSKYQGFLAAQKEGKLDLYQFAHYGEIIVSGEGKSPPDDITLKVCEMYQTDPATLFKTTDPEADAEKLAQAETKKKKKEYSACSGQTPTVT